MTVKKIIGKTHLWLGLTSGLIVFVIAITGCIYAFQMEISELTQPYRFVEPQQKSWLQPSQLQNIAERELPGKHPHSVVMDKRTDRAALVTFYEMEPEFYYEVYINPYTGEVLKVKNMDHDFFRFILMGHFYLWLPPTIGQPVAASATLVFVVMMITGLILWWPKNKGARKQRFKIKWNAKWRRVNYDLHNVLGFYMTWVGIILALTGLVWGFQWFAKSVYWVAGGNKSLDFIEPVSDSTKTATLKEMATVDFLYHKMKAEHPDAMTIDVHFPPTPQSAVEMAMNGDPGTYWKYDYRYFDQYTLKELPVDHIYGRFKDAAASDKLIRMNYDIHTGAILGFAGKVLMFFASLIVASLPITGFMIWWGRKKKAKQAIAAVEKEKRSVMVALR